MLYICMHNILPLAIFFWLSAAQDFVDILNPVHKKFSLTHTICGLMVYACTKISLLSCLFISFMAFISTILIYFVCLSPLAFQCCLWFSLMTAILCQYHMMSFFSDWLTILANNMPHRNKWFILAILFLSRMQFGNNFRNLFMY